MVHRDTNHDSKKKASISAANCGYFFALLTNPLQFFTSLDFIFVPGILQLKHESS